MQIAGLTFILLARIFFPHNKANFNNTTINYHPFLKQGFDN